SRRCRRLSRSARSGRARHCGQGGSARDSALRADLPSNQEPGAPHGEGLMFPRRKPAVPANFPAVPPAAAIFRQHLELAMTLAGEAAADAARLAKSAVFAAVTSKSGRLGPIAPASALGQ